MIFVGEMERVIMEEDEGKKRWTTTTTSRKRGRGLVYWFYEDTDRESQKGEKTFNQSMRNLTMTDLPL